MTTRKPRIRTVILSVVCVGVLLIMLLIIFDVFAQCTGYNKHVYYISSSAVLIHYLDSNNSAISAAALVRMEQLEKTDPSWAPALLRHMEDDDIFGNALIEMVLARVIRQHPQECLLYIENVFNRAVYEYTNYDPHNMPLWWSGIVFLEYGNYAEDILDKKMSLGSGHEKEFASLLLRVRQVAKGREQAMKMFVDEWRRPTG